MDEDWSWVKQHTMEAITILCEEYTRPSVLFQPRVFRDGDQWCVLLGEDLMEGISSFGNSPNEATRKFDAVWFEALSQKEKYNEYP